MSITTHPEHEAHEHWHHDPPEAVDGRWRVGLWLFIAGDVITLSAILFTYLYIRGVNTGGHWMSMYGYQGHTYAWYENALNGSAGLPAAKLITVKPLSAGLSWLVTAVIVVAAAVIWQGERGLRSTGNAKSYSSMASLATVVIVVAIILTIVQLRHIPQIFVANNDAQGMAYTAYDSNMMMIYGASLFHLIVLAFVGLGVSIRSARGVLSAQKWYQARLVRIFWVWIAISAVVVSLLTTTVNVIH